ncbi:MAG: hypothetical protein WDZ77_02555 [Candidatus Pacearchaeota archaeon]
MKKESLESNVIQENPNNLAKDYSEKFERTNHKGKGLVSVALAYIAQGINLMYNAFVPIGDLERVTHMKENYKVGTEENPRVIMDSELKETMQSVLGTLPKEKGIGAVYETLIQGETIRRRVYENE